ncbi:TonB-dependent receptor [uncultured Amphritea sp.]|uniref:TonB-dependent receptor plug domain-containing protein n=1 Tax=uncultured Amphritea sp. TaxID=981605 RepID=UPI0025CE7AE2|nr:TonB-dependent receptor [uncultured Amphritea sp.]
MSFVNIRRSINNLSVAFILCPLASFCAAQNALSELDYLNDLPVTFSATRLPQTLSEAPASITIIDRRMIEASSATTIPELFRLVPGMQSYHIATNASAVAYHGMSDKFPPRMEVMIDGRSVYIPLFSTVIWESLPISIDDIERIEVVRGTNTVTQGSNAFLGAINIITHSAFSPRENIVKYQQGEFDNKTVYSRYSAFHELGYYSVSAGITGNEGNRFSSGNSDPYFNRYFTFNTSISPTLLDTFTVNLGANSGYSSVGDIKSTNDPNIPDPKRREFETNYQYLNWTRQLGSENELQVSYSHSKNIFDARLMRAEETGLSSDAQAFLDINAPFKITAETGNIEQHDLEVSYRQKLNSQAQFVSGMNYRSGSAINRQLLDTTEWVSEESVRTFINLQYSKENWIYNLGLSAEKSKKAGKRVSPRLAANYQLSDSSFIRSSLSRAFRMPSLLESNYQTTIYAPEGFPLPVYDYSFTKNEDLRPEQIDTFDIGTHSKWQQYNSELDLRLFYEDISDGISESEISSPPELIALLKGKPPRTHTLSNSAQWHNKGIEMQYKYQSQSIYKPLIILNYGYIQSSGRRILSEVTNEIDPLETRNPTHTASALASVTLPNNLMLSINHYFLSSVQWIEAQRNVEKDPPNSPYHRTDLKISKAFRLSPQNELSIALIVQNLLDKPYSEFYAENMFEQRTYLQAQLSF